jgi:hypothetical protein
MKKSSEQFEYELYLLQFSAEYLSFSEQCENMDCEVYCNVMSHFVTLQPYGKNSEDLGCFRTEC